jgi:hypothetical protein
MILVVFYVILVVSIHTYAAQHKKVYSQIGLSFALIAAGILLSDYYIQFSVVPVSLMNQETDGIALLTQYNAHGVFIVLEELGYLLMSLSFLFIATVFANKGRLASVVRSVFIAGFVLTMAFLAVLPLLGMLRTGTLGVFLVFKPDASWTILVCGSFALAWMLLRTGLVLWTLRNPSVA